MGACMTVENKDEKEIDLISERSDHCKPGGCIAITKPSIPGFPRRRSRIQPVQSGGALCQARAVALRQLCDAQPCKHKINEDVEGVIWEFLKPVVVGFQASATAIAGGHGAGCRPDRFSSPWDISVTAEGVMYIADRLNHRIQRFAKGSSSGITVAGTGGTPGSNADQLRYPESVAICRDGSLLIADTGNHRIQRVKLGSMAGVTVAGGRGAGDDADQLDCPAAVVIAKDGSFLVTDSGNHRVQRFTLGNRLGTTVAGTGLRGCGPDELRYPRGLAIGPNDSVLVADTLNHRVQMFRPGSTEGVTVAGSHGPGKGANQLKTPRAVTVCPDGSILVADADNRRVQRFTIGKEEGVTVAGGRGRGNSSDQFDDFAALCIARDGALIVADSGNHRVQRFSPLFV